LRQRGSQRVAVTSDLEQVEQLLGLRRCFSGERNSVRTCPAKPSGARPIAAAAQMFSNTVSEANTCATWNEREMPMR